MFKKLIVNGSPIEELAAPSPDFDGLTNLELTKSILVSNSRSFSSRQVLDITSADIVELEFEDQTTWIGNAHEFHEVFNLTLSRGLEEDAIELPTMLQATGDRGILQDLAVHAVSLFKPKLKKVVGHTVHEIAKRVEEKVQPQPGLNLIDKAFRRREATSITDLTKPYLLFIHGTNSNTEGAFGGMLSKPDFGLWKTILNTYGEKVLAFDHKTLTESPLQNTKRLLELLPANITLHLITHSRGGLVGDLLARTHAGNGTIGFSEAEFDVMKGRVADLEAMNAINELGKVKNIRIEKFIRVASPSMGTSLMADRLDHYLNALLNLIGIGTGMKANPVYLGVKALLSEVASSKTNIDVLPGLEAMSPESPFIKMLNNPGTVIEAPLTVISGNCIVHLELKALLVILTKLYFRRQNDLVVDTWSMYFGTPRRKAIQFVLDDEQGTDHVHYFGSEASQTAIISALIEEDEKIPGFKILEETDIAEANRNAALPFIVSEVKMDTKVSGKKPIAIIIPGIMGSNLYKGDDRIWVDFWRFVKGDLVELNINAPNITARSLMGSGYRKLARYLVEENYDVVAFAYDWRKNLTEEAVKLDEVIKTLLTEKKPVHVIAHSMGGVLFREFMLLNSQWPSLNASPGFKALFLGVPLGGSYLIPETLTGRGGNIAKLSMLDLKHGKQDLLSVFAACPGLYNLLPLSETPHDFADIGVWKKMLGTMDTLGVEPTGAILKNFTAFRKRIKENGLADFKNIIYVAGKDRSTTASFVIEKTARGERLVFQSTAAGDGSVTWESGIPQVLKDRDAVYYTNTTHGELANNSTLFDAFKELLNKGTTAALRKTPPALDRTTIGLTDNPRYEIVPITPNNLETVVLDMKPFDEKEEVVSPIKITISNGDLRDASYPLIVGHFYRDGIMGAEKVLDDNFNGLLREMHALHLYPGKIGTAEVILSKHTRPRGAIVIGMGDPGDLNGYQLELSVTQGVSKYLMELRELENVDRVTFNELFKTGVGISTVIVGAGYGGLSVENAIKSIVLGIQKSNESIGSLNNPSLQKIDHVEIIELYEDRALQAFYILKRLEEESQLNIVVWRNRIRKLFGVRKRVPLDEQQDWWQRISVSIEKKEPHDILKFSASTGAAREEVRNLNSNPKIVQHFIDRVSKDNRWTPSLAKTIFELLIPNDFKDAVRNQNNIVWKLDKHSAAYPWELIQDTTTQSKPLCVSAGMVRQLATSDYRTQINRSYKNNALVVGDPLLSGSPPQLEHAEKEAMAVKEIIADNGYTVTSKIKTDFSEIIEALFQDEYKIIHLAGHGDFDPANPEQGGMIIGDKLFLTSKEIDQMSQVPEFVFINCCYLGKVDAAVEARAQHFYKLAANIGVQLIEMGVKAVIAAGWAVNDAAALLFAETFYKQMFDGRPFGEAVKDARSACFKSYRQSNTWGAYQCYGDQFYTFPNVPSGRKKQKTYILPVEIEVDLMNLYNATESGRYSSESILKDMEEMSEAIDRSGLRNGTITELEALIYAALNKKKEAIAKLHSLRILEDASFSVKSLERLCNLNIKLLKIKEDATGSEVQDVIRDFELLKEIGATSERLSLLGSAYKTLFEKVKTKADKTEALAQSAFSYQEGFRIAKLNNASLIYSLTNWLQLESVLLLIKETKTYRWGSKSPKGYDVPKLNQALGWLDKLLEDEDAEVYDLDFWKMMNKANVLLTKLCMEPSGKVTKDIVSEAIIGTWQKGGPSLKKQSELDHLSFLLAALSLSAKPKARTLAASLQYIFDELNKFQK